MNPTLKVPKKTAVIKGILKRIPKDILSEMSFLEMFDVLNENS